MLGHVLCGASRFRKRGPLCVPSPAPPPRPAGRRPSLWAGLEARLQLACRPPEGDPESPRLGGEGPGAPRWAPPGSCCGRAGLGAASRSRGEGVREAPWGSSRSPWSWGQEGPGMKCGRAGAQAPGQEGGRTRMDLLPAAGTPQLFCRDGPGAQGAPQLTAPLPDAGPWGARPIQAHHAQA